jgi:hypothetical protein
MAFDQVEFITLLTDYYEFCNRVFWDNSVVPEAPNNGWPSITQSTMANLHKTNAVIDLLRHMPFVDFVEPDKAYGKHVTMVNTRIQDYRSDEMQNRIRDGDLEYYVEPICDPLPPSCISFGNSNGRNGYNLVVNTADGNVYRPSEFFALCKQRFRELRWIGLQTDVVEAVPMDWDFDDAEGEFKALMRKMRRAGWPGDEEGRDWDREAFLAALDVYSDEEDEHAVREATEALDDTHVH